MELMDTLIISIVSERFGIKEQHTTKISAVSKPNRRDEKITKVRQELKSVWIQYRKTSEEDKDTLAEMRTVVRGRLTTLQRAKRHRKKSKEKACKRNAFIAKPFRITKKLLG